MDLRVDDGQIIPLRYRITCRAGIPMPAGAADATLPFPTDSDGRLLAYSDKERDAITAALDKLKFPYTIEPEDQPDPAILAACQGNVRTRSEALAALAAGRPPATLADLTARVQQLETATPVAEETRL